MMARLSSVSRMSVLGRFFTHAESASAARAAAIGEGRERMRPSNHGAGAQSIRYTPGMPGESLESLRRFFETSPAARKATRSLGRDARVALVLPEGPARFGMA